MSYILDALRKSDEEHRKHGAEPLGSGLSFSRRPIPRRRRRTFSLILVSCMAIAGLILGFGYWWSQWDLRRTPVTIIEAMPSSQRSPDAPLPLQAAGREKPQEAALIPESESLSSTAPAVQPAEPAPPKAELLDIGSSSAEMLPDLHFSGHVYSPTPELRMIMINDAVVREGQMISPDLTLLEITEAGVILRFKGTPHEIDLF